MVNVSYVSSPKNTHFTMCFFFLLLFRNPNFLPQKESDEEKESSRIIFPYYPHMKKEFKLFSDYENQISEEKSIATLSVDCSKHRSLCSKYHLYPGKISVSFEDHEKTFPIEITNFSIESLFSLQKLVENKGHISISTEDEIKDIIKSKDLFLFVARPNSGDLIEKKDIFESISEEKIGDKKVVFGYVLDPILYEKYSHYPYISFVYISRNGTIEHYLGEFDKGNMLSFISSKVQENKKLIKFIIADNDDNNRNKLFNVFHQLEYEKIAKMEIETLDSNSENFAAKKNVLCEGETNCLAIFEQNTHHFISISHKLYQNNDETSIFSTIHADIINFDEKWNSLNFIQRTKQKIMYFYVFKKLEFDTIIGIIAVFVILFALWSIDSKHIIDLNSESNEEENEEIKEEKKQKNPKIDTQKENEGKIEEE